MTRASLLRQGGDIVPRWSLSTTRPEGARTELAVMCLFGRNELKLHHKLCGRHQLIELIRLDRASPDRVRLKPHPTLMRSHLHAVHKTIWVPPSLPPLWVLTAWKINNLNIPCWEGQWHQRFIVTYIDDNPDWHALIWCHHLFAPYCYMPKIIYVAQSRPGLSLIISLWIIINHGRYFN